MVTKSSAENLAVLVALQMAGIIVLEVLLWFCVLIGVIPPSLGVVSDGEVLLQINTGFIVIMGLIFVLVAGFWLAILTEVFNIIEITKIKLKL